MKIDKAKLMKNAWKIARHGFYNAAFRSISIPGEKNFTEEQIENLCSYSLDDKREAFFSGARLRGTMTIDFTVRDFFAESLKIAWSRAKLKIKKQIEKQLERERNEMQCDENLANVAEINKNAPRRELVPAEKYSEGEKIRGFVITGLGKTFRPNADMFSLSITPDTDYVQYAYFN